MLTYDIPNLHQPKHPASQRTYISQNTLPHQQCRCLQNTGCAIKWTAALAITVSILSIFAFWNRALISSLVSTETQSHSHHYKQLHLKRWTHEAIVRWHDCSADDRHNGCRCTYWIHDIWCMQLQCTTGRAYNRIVYSVIKPNCTFVSINFVSSHLHRYYCFFLVFCNVWLYALMYFNCVCVHIVFRAFCHTVTMVRLPHLPLFSVNCTGYLSTTELSIS